MILRQTLLGVREDCLYPAAAAVARASIFSGPHLQETIGGTTCSATDAADYHAIYFGYLKKKFNVLFLPKFIISTELKSLQKSNKMQLFAVNFTYDGGKNLRYILVISIIHEAFTEIQRLTDKSSVSAKFYSVKQARSSFISSSDVLRKIHSL